MSDWKHEPNPLLSKRDFDTKLGEFRCPDCEHPRTQHTAFARPILKGCCGGDAESGNPNIKDIGKCGCLRYVPKDEREEGGNMPETEVGKGSPLKKWVCSCDVHTVNIQTGQTRRGPYIIRCTGDGLTAICQWCEQPFRRVDEGLPRKRKSKICGAHCPEGAHNHD